MKGKTYFRTMVLVCSAVCMLVFGTLCVQASPYRLGDIDADGTVNAADALLALQSAAQIKELDTDQLLAADVNKDRQASAEDALQILKFAAKMDIFRISVAMTAGQDPYTIDQIYDTGACEWCYTLEPAQGLTVTKEVRELPEDSSPGTMAEQVYTVTAQEAGTYTLDFRLCPAGNPYGRPIEEMVFEIHVKAADALTPFALSEAFYPQMAQYPNDAEQLMNQKGPAYEAWENDLMKQQRDLGDISGLQKFFRQSAAVFLKVEKGENIVYSPLNAYMALSMLAQVTGGQSRSQILTLLGSQSMDMLRMQADDVWNSSYRNDGIQTVIPASSIWLNQKLNYKKSMLDTLARSFYASSYQGEMGSDALNQALQDWLNTQTGGLLKDQTSDIKMKPETVLALATTLFYKAKWNHPFRKEDTRSQIFHSPKGDVTTAFLHQDVSQRYYWGEHFIAVDQAFEAGGRMWFLLPEEGMSPEELLADEEAMEFLFMDHRNKWEKTDFAFVRKAIPKFDVSSKFELQEGLQQLGVKDIFDPERSDFTPLTTDVGFSTVVSQTDHAARVMIDEEGCTAAAFTVFGGIASSAPTNKIDFTLDRPFLFCITGENELPLFTGVVNTPEVK